MTDKRAAIQISADTLPVALSSFQRDLVLSACPRGTSIRSARPIREGTCLCPLWVETRLPRGTLHAVLLRLDRMQGGVEHEARLLPHLARTGLPVATVLAGPSVDPDAPQLGAMAVYSVLPGQNLLQRLYQADAAQKVVLAGLLLDAIDSMQALTAPLERILEEAGRSALLPRKGLAYEFRAAASADRLLDQSELREAVAALAPRVHAVQESLVFWNGDFNPANFLSDGERITGYVDFVHAAWHDPHYGLARYTIYPWIHLDRPALFAEYRRRHRVSEGDFALRSAVHCLWMLAGCSDHVLDETDAAIIRGQLRQDLHVLGT